MTFTRIKVTAVSDTGVFVARDNTSGYYVFTALEPKPISVGDIFRIPDWKLGEDPLQTAIRESNGKSLAVSVECWGGARPVAIRMLEHIGQPKQVTQGLGGAEALLLADAIRPDDGRGVHHQERDPPRDAAFPGGSARR